MDNITIRMAVDKDLSSIAYLHRKCFKGYFISSLGIRLIQNYYKVYLHEAPEIFFVAENTKCSLVGFVMGYFPDSTAVKRFVKENFLSLAYRTVLLVLCLNKNAWKSLINNLYAFMSPLLSKNQTLEIQSKIKCADLLSICVLNEYQGSGVSSMLVDCFVRELKGHDYNCFTLSVDPNNGRARNFYNKVGMTIISETKNEIRFLKHI
jgi:ribosomal protein S18 acetylase RimI-like enzyme